MSYTSGDYHTALDYFEQSLQICLEIGDKCNEGVIINNISQIYIAWGEYDAIALGYLEQSLKIRQEIGDKSGITNILHSLAMISMEKEDYQKYWEHETSAYSLAQETEDAVLIYQIGRILGVSLCTTGNTEKGIPVLQRCITIGEAAGFLDVREVDEVLKEYQE